VGSLFAETTLKLGHLQVQGLPESDGIAIEESTPSEPQLLLVERHHLMSQEKKLCEEIGIFVHSARGVAKDVGAGTASN
jgi:hypothetical protein